jgi:hypothetical protein
VGLYIWCSGALGYLSHLLPTLGVLLRLRWLIDIHVALPSILDYTGLMERPPLPIRDCKRGHYHEATEEYWYWSSDKDKHNGGRWRCRECERVRVSLRLYGEIRPRARRGTKRGRPPTWAKCGHTRDAQNTYIQPSTGNENCRECRRESHLRHESHRYQRPLAWAKYLLDKRRYRALKRIAARKARLERDIINGTL